MTWMIARSERDLQLKHAPSHSSAPGNEFADAVAKAARTRWFPDPLTCDSISDAECGEERKNVCL